MSKKRTLPKVDSFVQPYPTAYKLNGNAVPTALEREVTTVNQTRFDESTLKWGDDDAFPLRLIHAVNNSPTTLSCIGTIETFTRGGGFSNPALENIVINKDGLTLWGLHCLLSNSEALLDSFAANFKFNGDGQITNTYYMGVESLRFKRPIPDESKNITAIKYNPYFGTAEYQKKYTSEYPLWNQDNLPADIKQYGTKFPGQVYYSGQVRPPFKFYSVPKYWSGEGWIYVDGGIQNFHKKNLDNGFFLSVLMNVIGDPNAPSTNPKYQKEVTGTDGIKRMESTKTVGEEFSEMMSKMFSGTDKAGTIMALWSLNMDQATKLQPFPVNAQFDVMQGTFQDAIRGITIATEVPAILANLPQQGSSLGSDGASMLAAIQLMQARTAHKRRTLEQFYNNILLPNLVKPVKEKVSILNYSPIETGIDDKTLDLMWAWMNDQEKADFVKTNYPQVKVIRPVITPTTVQVDPETGEPVPVPEINDSLANLQVSQINRILSILKKFAKGELTIEQATQFLKSYGISDDQIPAWLNQSEA